MSRIRAAAGVAIAVVLLAVGLPGGAMYNPVVRPTLGLSRLSPELENLADDRIDTYLKADVRPTFPSVLAVAKITAAPSAYYDQEKGRVALLEVLRGEEADGWRKMAGGSEAHADGPIAQVQLVSPLLGDRDPSLKSLRDAAALLHAPLLLVYMQEDSA